MSSDGASVTSGGSDGGDAIDASPGRDAHHVPATLSEVQTIFDAHCTSCHKANVGIPGFRDLPLTSDVARAGLVDATTCDGKRMPRAFEVGTAPPLMNDEITPRGAGSGLRATLRAARSPQTQPPRFPSAAAGDRA